MTEINKENRTIAVLGSTGSIGTQTLDVARRMNYKVTALSANSDTEMLEKQCRAFLPAACYISEGKYADLKQRLSDMQIKIYSGKDGLEALANDCRCDILFNSVMGKSGLRPTLAAIESGKKRIALSNKETLVAGGTVVMNSAHEKGVELIPVDSEHSAIFQCLQCGNTVDKIYLTASGGPFFGKKRDELKAITKKEALRHPNWSMGAKITVDSSTLMNKGLEFIEAVHLFGVSPSQIKVIIHRESVIHSMVGFVDGAVIAQLGMPDMRLCIQYAATYPDRVISDVKKLDFASIGSLTFAEPDTETFSLLSLAVKAIERGGNIPAVMNGANEAAVELFLQDKIKYLDIFDLVTEATEKAIFIPEPTIDDIENSDLTAREFVFGKVRT